jgi:hypothetical protein
MVPIKGPCLMMASSAYREQLGTKRQDLGKSGENNTL